MFATPSQVSILTVSKLNRFAKSVLESEIGLVWVTGEISNFVAASSGHWYFTLKDSQAQVRTAMFKGSNQRAGFLPKTGDKVVVRANISLYEPRGDYQLIAQHIEPEGIGQLKQAYEALKGALQQEGLFQQDRKRALPSTVHRLGVVTSPTGAAIHDILHVLARRNPAIEVIVYPSLVQGEQAAASIVKQIEIANVRNEVDILIVGRGGGSLEDLWPFNEEIVARAIFGSKLPIVSAVGHEVDVTIADFVADLRAPTPSAAAESISQDAIVLRRNIEQMRERLMLATKQAYRQRAQSLDMLCTKFYGESPQKRINQYQQSLLNAQKRLANSHPKASIDGQQKALSQILERLQRTMKAILSSAHERQISNKKGLVRLEPSKLILSHQNQLTLLKQKLVRAQQLGLEKQKSLLASRAGLLNSVSPLSTLSRGYSITYQEDNIVRSINDVGAGEHIVTKLTDGEILAQVISTQAAEK
jgi:exodeoxyribonuclease VII large subunit